MRRFKQFFSVLMIAAVLGAAVPPRKAEAGIALIAAGLFKSPVAVAGVVVLVFGLVYDNFILIVLDENGNVAQDSLTGALGHRYSFIEDQEALADLATLIREKAQSAAPNEKGEILVSITADEVLKILEPTGLVESEPAKVAAMIAELE